MLRDEVLMAVPFKAWQSEKDRPPDKRLFDRIGQG